MIPVTLAIIEKEDCFSRFGHPEQLGLLMVSVAGILSVAAIVLLILLVIRNYLKYVRGNLDNSKSLLQSHIGLYFLSLIVGDVIQAMGAVMSLKWAVQGTSKCSAYCDVQGAFNQFGELAVSISTMWIAIFTFLVIFFRWDPPKSKMVPYIVLGLTWTFMVSSVVVGWVLHGSKDPHERYYTPTPYWCYLGHEYMNERIATGYFWMWLAGFVSLVLYTLIFFKLRGFIAVTMTKFPRFKIILPRWRSHHSNKETASNTTSFSLSTTSTQSKTLSLSPLPMTTAQKSEKDAIMMLAYPICYIILIIPLSIVRWITFTKGLTPFAATAAAIVVFKLSGLVNVILFLATRKGLLRSPPSRISRVGEKEGSPKLKIVLTDIGYGMRRKDDMQTSGSLLHEHISYAPTRPRDASPIDFADESDVSFRKSLLKSRGAHVIAGETAITYHLHHDDRPDQSSFVLSKEPEYTSSSGTITAAASPIESEMHKSRSRSSIEYPRSPRGQSESQVYSFPLSASFRARDRSVGHDPLSDIEVLEETLLAPASPSVATPEARLTRLVATSQYPRPPPHVYAHARGSWNERTPS